MKIAHVAPRFSPPGGIVTNVRELARGLKKEGDDVEVYTSNVRFLWRADRGRDDSREVEGIPVHRFPVRDGFGNRVYLGWLKGLVRALAESEARVIHVHGHRLATVLEAALASKRSGIPLVVTTSFHPAERSVPPLKRGLIRLADVGFGASAYQVARAIIVQSDLEAQLVGAFAPASRIRQIPPGVDLAEWSEPATADLGGLDLPAEYFLLAGWIQRRKGIDHLLDALARLPAPYRRPLVVVGRDLGALAELQALARQLGLADSVSWTEPLPRPAYRAVMRRATALVLPSEWEAFGMVLLEAMAARVPVVATRVGGMPEVLEEGRAGLLVPYGDPEALARALRSVVEDPAATRTRVQRGLERVAGMDWSVIAHRHHELYLELAGT